LDRSRKRVLHIITRSDWAGGQKVLYTLVYGLKKFYPNEFEIEVACGPENGMLIPELEKIGIKVHIVRNLVREISPIKDIKAFFELRKLIKSGNYDIVHLHSSKAGLLGRIAAKTAGVKKVIYTVHGWWGIEQYNGLKRKILIFAERFTSKFCDKIVFLCTNDLIKAKDWKIGKEHQYAIIPNAIIPPEKVQKGKLRKELGLPDDVKLVGNVARLDRQKNPVRFLNIAEQVLKQRDDVVFVWIGGSVVEDEYGQYVDNFLKSHPEFSNKIFFLGFRKDAPQLIADFDIFLLTSDSEGFPLVLLEAMHQGTLPIVTKNGCQSDVIRHGENGYLYEKDEEAVEQILDLLNYSPQTSDLLEKAAQTVNFYSVRNFVDNYRNQYEL